MTTTTPRTLTRDNLTLMDSILTEYPGLKTAWSEAHTLLADPSDNFYVVALVPETGDEGDTSFSLWPLRYYDICPGAHRDMPLLNCGNIEGLIHQQPVMLVTRSRTICQ